MSGEVAHAFARLGWEAVSADILPGEKPDMDYRDLRSALYDDDPCAGGLHGSARHYRGDVRDLFSWDHPVNAQRKWEAENLIIPITKPSWLWDLFIGHPPCDHLSQAGAVWWKHKDATRGGDGRMQEGAAFFMEMTRAPAPLVAVENPVGIMGNAPRKGQDPHPCFYRVPDQVVHPWWFGDPLEKRTCLWLKGLPLLVADRPVEATGRVATGGGSWRTDQRSGRGANNGHEDARGRAFRKIERSRTLPGFARAMATQWTAFAEAQERRAA